MYFFIGLLINFGHASPMTEKLVAEYQLAKSDDQKMRKTAALLLHLEDHPDDPRYDEAYIRQLLSEYHRILEAQSLERN